MVHVFYRKLTVIMSLNYLRMFTLFQRAWYTSWHQLLAPLNPILAANRAQCCQRAFHLHIKRFQSTNRSPWEVIVSQVCITHIHHKKPVVGHCITHNHSPSETCWRSLYHIHTVSPITYAHGPVLLWFSHVHNFSVDSCNSCTLTAQHPFQWHQGKMTAPQCISQPPARPPNRRADLQIGG